MLAASPLPFTVDSETCRGGDLLLWWVVALSHTWGRWRPRLLLLSLRPRWLLLSSELKEHEEKGTEKLENADLFPIRLLPAALLLEKDKKRSPYVNLAILYCHQAISEVGLFQLSVAVSVTTQERPTWSFSDWFAKVLVNNREVSTPLPSQFALAYLMLLIVLWFPVPLFCPYLSIVFEPILLYLKLFFPVLFMHSPFLQ